MRRASPLIAFLTSLVVVAAGLAPASAVVAKQPLIEGYGSYPRLVRVQYSASGRGRILAALTSQDDGGEFTPVVESTDEGASFHRIGAIHDPDGVFGECCGTLYELPQRVGALAPGTLLWAASYGQDSGARRRVGIKVWASRDGGHTWAYLAEAALSHNHDGVWEPEFTVDAGGTLWLHYADETQAPEYAQVLNRVASTDGVTWGTKQLTLAIPPDRVRPGMPIIRRLPDGRYWLSYEICNYGDRYCDPYFKISPDGANWGSPTDPGTRVTTANGDYFQHAQTVTLFPGGPRGVRLVMVGQIYTDAGGTPVSAKNGQVLLVNDELGAGDWYEVPAPILITGIRNEFCPNYSSTLLPVDDGKGVLEVATEDDDGCKAYFGRGPMP
ncbi:sialidase family protein [Amycolatopsis sp. PS_44_ISF1]|uniref:sialidase family protein n=1 Tax=Amycolatopsis sp. PS_44_ISF1 TaxID=2974917 RepID=UPI0028DD73FA|nr:sialidase family protein [Amycolatopsis sp. PS_44_ISF1]MDT8909823.1 glycoside hydrolase [Amycolatopsis sp. PS_44_ISF1]